MSRQPPRIKKVTIADDYTVSGDFDVPIAHLDLALPVGSRLHRKEVEDMARRGYLAPGQVFRSQNASYKVIGAPGHKQELSPL